MSLHPTFAEAMTRPLASRRHWLLGGAAFLLSACDQLDSLKKPSLNGIDLTGATYGQDFRLTDTAGQVRTLADYRGSVVMLFFGFAQCPDVCPTALARAVEVKRLLGVDASRLRVLFITIDPERDTPEVLREYMSAFDPEFVGLRGDEVTTLATAKAFKVFYQKVATGSSYTMDHTALTYVFDPQGRLRIALRHEQNAAAYAADVRTLLTAA